MSIYLTYLLLLNQTVGDLNTRLVLYYNKSKFFLNMSEVQILSNNLNTRQFVIWHISPIKDFLCIFSPVFERNDSKTGQMFLLTWWHPPYKVTKQPRVDFLNLELSNKFIDSPIYFSSINFRHWLTFNFFPSNLCEKVGWYSAWAKIAFEKSTPSRHMNTGHLK